jgi:hypothetical protein
VPVLPMMRLMGLSTIPTSPARRLRLRTATLVRIEQRLVLQILARRFEIGICRHGIGEPKMPSSLSISTYWKSSRRPNLSLSMRSPSFAARASRCLHVLGHLTQLGDAKGISSMGLETRLYYSKTETSTQCPRTTAKTPNAALKVQGARAPCHTGP